MILKESAPDIFKPVTLARFNLSSFSCLFTPEIDLGWRSG
jgi:hypothetical protein